MTDALATRYFILNTMGSDPSKDKKEFDADALLHPLKLTSIVDSRLYETTKSIVTHLHQGNYTLIEDYFKNRQKNLPHLSQQPSIPCNRAKKNDEPLYECKTCSYLTEGVYFCAECFSEQRHLGHDFRVLEQQQGFCSCGNHQILQESSFCKNHFKNNTPIPPMDASLKKQLKFSLQFLLFLHQDSKRLKLQESSYKYFGEPLLKYLLQVCNNSTNAYGIAQVLMEKLDLMTSSQIQLKSVGKNLLQNLLVVFTDTVGILSSLSQLLLKLRLVDEIGIQLLRQFYDSLLHNKSISNVFSTMRYDFRKCYRNQISYFSLPTNCRFVITRKMDSDAQANKYLNNYFHQLKVLFCFKNSTAIVSRIMGSTKISDLLNISRHFTAVGCQQARNLSIFSSIVSYSFIAKIHAKDQLQAVIKDTLQAIIKKKGVIFDLTQQRAFGLAVYKYYGYTVPNRNELMAILCGFFPEFKSEVVDIALRFLLTRDLYHQQYQSAVKKCSDDSVCELALLAADNLYFKILCSLLANDGRHIDLAKLFITKKVPHAQEGISNASQLKQILSKFNVYFITVNNSLQSNVYEFIVSALLGNNKPRECLLGTLAVAYDGVNAAIFKRIASRFALSGEVKIFIKERLWLQGKKIHLKEEIKNELVFSPFSEFITEQPAEIVTERMANIFNQCKIDNEDFKLFAADQSIIEWQKILSVCLSYLQANPNAEEQVQQQLKKAFQNLHELSVSNKSKDLLALTIQFYRKLSSPLLQNFFKKVLQVREKQTDEQGQKNNSKKKQKLNEMKQKQKQMLEAFGVEEQQRVEQCIVCKNSKAGNPFLLANFGYKNIFASILKAETPFLQFSSCGHYIHQECLHQSHKGEFKIWYPCILCKSICNILLPNISNAAHSKEESREEYLGRVINFLKNLGGIYTFFYQDRAQLIQFKLDNVEAVFPLLFKTLVYQMTFYPLLNLQYFQRSQLPVTKFLFDLLLFTSQSLPNVPITKPIELTGDPLFLTLYRFISDQLTAFYSRKSPKEAHPDLPMDALMIVQEILAYLQEKQGSLQICIKPPKTYKDIVVGGFVKPPADLRELQGKAEECSSCQKTVTNYQKCLLCGVSYCQVCSEVKKVHSLEAHLSESVFIRNYNGKYTYVHEQLQGEFNSLYADYLGEDYSGPQRAVPNEFLLSKQRWQGLVDDLVTNRVHREIMKAQ